MPPLLEGVAENVGPCTDFGLFPDGACRFRRAYALKRMAEAVSGILPREDKATAMRVLSRPGEARFSACVVTVCTADGGDDERGTVVGTRRCMSPHVFAIVMARSGRLLSASWPMAPSMLTHKDHEKDVGAEACPRS